MKNKLRISAFHASSESKDVYVVAEPYVFSLVSEGAWKEMGIEAGKSASVGAGLGAVKGILLAMSAVKASVIKTAGKSVAASTTRNAGSSIAKTALRVTAMQTAKAAARSNVFTSIGVFVVQQSVDTFRVVRRKISGRECGLRSAENAGDTAGSLGGAVGGAIVGTFICPGVGTTFGCFVGGLFGSLTGRFGIGRVRR